MHIIGINGYKRSGKGEVGNAIEANVLVGQVKQVGFADQVKVFGARALGFLELTDRECIALMDEAKESWLVQAYRDIDGSLTQASITGRQYLQNVGTEARKLFGDDFWVDQVLSNPSEGTFVDHHHVDWLVITDLRFENEAQRVLDLGGEVWRVNRPGTGSDGHDSEQRLPNKYVTRELHNDGDLNNLENEVQGALHFMEGGI